MVQNEDRDRCASYELVALFAIVWLFAIVCDNCNVDPKIAMARSSAQGPYFRLLSFHAFDTAVGQRSINGRIMMGAFLTIFS